MAKSRIDTTKMDMKAGLSFVQNTIMKDVKEFKNDVKKDLNSIGNKVDSIEKQVNMNTGRHSMLSHKLDEMRQEQRLAFEKQERAFEELHELLLGDTEKNEIGVKRKVDLLWDDRMKYGWTRVVITSVVTALLITIISKITGIV